MKLVLKNIIYLILVLILYSPSVRAHFLVLIPDKDNIEVQQKDVKLEAKFTHPMEGGPNMDFKIIDSGVWWKGEKNTLEWQEKKIFSMKSSGKKVSMYTSVLYIKKPGVYQIYIEPEPYFESSEEKFIKQITKVIVQALGMEEGWDQPIGLKAEIVPMIKPFSLWEGNTFKGQVLINGKPAKNIKVEVEYLNEKGIKVPADSFITQVIKTDENGYFEYTIPWAGWWGFSAIGEGGMFKGSDGKEYPLELDAVIWVKAYPKPKEVK